MRILLTGGTGFLGRVLLLKLLQRGHEVNVLARRSVEVAAWAVMEEGQIQPYNVKVIHGDVTLPQLGLSEVPEVDAVVHCAGLVSFSNSDKHKLYETNAWGTLNLLNWMTDHGITRLFHVSTAYLFHRNHYEVSKELAEYTVKSYPGVKTTIFRPSIIIGDSGLHGLPPVTGLYLAVKHIDHAKRWFEKKSHAWPLRPKIRVKGKRGGRLNLIPVDIVAKNMADIITQDREGLFWLTHPNPPRLREVEKAVSEAVGADIRIAARFKPNFLERAVSLGLKELAPYLQGDKLPSDITCPPLDDSFLRESMKSFLSNK